MKLQTRLIIASALAATAGAASATTCDSALSSYQYYASSGQTTFAANILSNHPECFGGSASNSQTQINGTAFQQISAVTATISSRFLNTGVGPQASLGNKGMAAGSASKAWNVWGSVGNNDTKQSYTSANSGIAKNSTDVLNTVFGADYALSSTLVVGVSAAFDDTDGSGRNTAATDINKVKGNGYNVAPYIGLQLAKDLALDASIGFGQGELKMKGNASAITTKAEADRLFAGINLNYAKWLGNIQLVGKVGYLHGEEKYGNMKDSAGVNYLKTGGKNTIDQMRAGIQAGYWLNGFMPYIGVGYVSDINRDSTQIGATNNPIGKDAWTWTVGGNFFAMSNSITGGIAYNQEEGRNHQKNNSLTGNVSFRF